VSRPKLMELASCDFIGRAEDVILAGPIGTEKSHVTIALGVEATRRRRRVHFTRAADLVQSLVEARDERRLSARRSGSHLNSLLNGGEGSGSTSELLNRSVSSRAS